MDHGAITLRKATLADLQGILDLLAIRNADDLRLLLWIPEPFQSWLLEQELSKERLFVAVNKDDGAIISLRKAFIVEDHDELHELFEQNLQCTHAQRELMEHGFFNCNLEFFQRVHAHFMPNRQMLYVYIASAFTHHKHRNKWINEQLTVYAYAQLREEVRHKIRVHNHTAIALLYCLVHENSWRTMRLVRQFFPFAQSMSKELGLAPAEKISFYSYKAYKPEVTISPAGELVRLPDDQCVPVLGCVLLYELNGG